MRALIHWEGAPSGSGLVFEDAGEHELKGVPDPWRLYRVLHDVDSPRIPDRGPFGQALVLPTPRMSGP